MLESPGHIRHHLAYQVELDGTLLTGDAMGIILGPGSPVHTPTPPPSLDLVAWYDTLEGWASLDVPVFGVTHFGWHERFQERRQEFLMALRSHEDRVRSDLEAGINGAKAYAAEVVERMTPGPDRTWIEGYFETFGAEADWQGVAFYLNRRARRINRSS